MKNSFWNNRKVFITGHTGFKGSWLTLWLNSLGAKICGYALKPASKKSLFYEADVSNGIESNFANILNYKVLCEKINNFSPEVVLHLAAQPLVKKSYLKPLDTFSTNISGTINLLESLRYCKNIRSIVVVTTDKVYKNKETKDGYRESDSLGGFDPYSSSKACCEIITNCYRSSFFKNKNLKIGIATARAGNVIGGGDYSENRLVPDIFRSIKEKKAIKVRNIESTRPWQHVLEALNGYITLAESLYYNHKKYSEAWNFGPRSQDCRKVKWILSEFQKKHNFDIIDTSNHINDHESKTLNLDISKSLKKLSWKPYLPINEAIQLTSQWFKQKEGGKLPSQIIKDQINYYEEKKLFQSQSIRDHIQ